MKKIVIAVVILWALVGGYFYLRTLRIRITPFEAEIKVARRGDLSIPIKASGKIQPRSKREIKSRASGEIIPREPSEVEVGQIVRQGDVLVKLKEDYERRSRDARKEALTQARIAVAMAEIDLRQRKEVAIPAAEAARKRAAANLKRVTAEYLFKENLLKTNPDAIPPVEWVTIQSQYEIAQADLAAAQADLDKAKLSVEAGEKDVERLRSAAVSAERQLEDAEERLRETTVRSPIDGMILQRFRNVGEMIQSGTESLTGGTVLMEIADISEVYMIASVDEADIGKVREMAPANARPGMQVAPAATSQPTTAYVEQDVIEERTPVEITVEAFPDDLFHGEIERIAPESVVQQAVATFEVRIRITSPNRDKIRGLAGIQAEAKFTSVPVKGAVLVPYEAIMRDEKTNEQGVYVPVIRPGSREEEPEFRPCRLGQDNGVDVVVLSGIEPGQRVYTKLPVKTRTEKKAAGEEVD